MQHVVEEMTFALSEGLQDQLEAIYLYGSMAQGRFQQGESDVNMMVVVADGANIHAMRKVFLPIWREHSANLRRAPLVAQRSAFERHMKLFPGLAEHLAADSVQLLGDRYLLDQPPTPDPRESFARLAYHTMQASAAIAPDLLPPEREKGHLAELRRLVRQLSGRRAAEEKPAAQLLAEIQHYLKQEIDRSPFLETWVGPRRSTTSLLLPSLEGAYKELGQLIMSFSVLSPHQVVNTDWQQLSQQLAKHYTGLKITTSTQLRLIVEFIDPVAYMFQRYEHEWGVDLLAAVPVSKSKVLCHAARTASGIEIDALPNAYLTQEDDQIGKLIHDFQNKILNIQLEHELLHRTQQIEKCEPPEPLPDRTAAPEKRIDAILKQLGWWADHYTDQMAQYA